VKRVSTREFLRNINKMREPVQVYSRATLKGTWLPGDMTWPTEQHLSLEAIPTSEPMTFRVDAEPHKDIEALQIGPMPMKARKAIRKGATYEG